MQWGSVISSLSLLLSKEENEYKRAGCYTVRGVGALPNMAVYVLCMHTGGHVQNFMYVSYHRRVFPLGQPPNYTPVYRIVKTSVCANYSIELLNFVTSDVIKLQ